MMDTATDNEEGWLPREHRGRILGLAAMVFLILCSYAIARPATESLFVAVHGAEALPKAWLWVAVGTIGVVSLYGHWAARIDLVRGFGVISTISALVLFVLHWAIRRELPYSHYLLFMWKDIYIVVLVEVFWSFANQVMPVKKASRVYGFFLIIGGLGGMLGNLLGGELATRVGTETVLLGAIPLLLMAQLGCIWIGRMTGGERRTAEKRKRGPGLEEGLRILLGSRILVLLMLLIALTQVVINLVDYQTQLALEQFFPDTDERTAMTGKIYAAVDFVALGLQLSTGPLLRTLGVPVVMLLIPSLLLGCVIGAAFVPRMITVAVVKVASKAFDYSIFRAAKEIFYIPLSHTEKTQGKAFVDMMTYRVSKGLVSLLLLSLGAISTGSIWVLTMIGVLAWIVCVLGLIRLSPELSEPASM